MTRKIVKGKIIWTCCYKNCMKKATSSYELNNGMYIQFCEEHSLRGKVKDQKEFKQRLELIELVFADLFETIEYTLKESQKKFKELLKE